MKQSATLPKYRQPQLDDGRSLADQASAANTRPAAATGKPSAKVTSITRTSPRAQQPATGRKVPGFNLNTTLILIGVMAVGAALGVPLGAWLFIQGVRL